MGYLDDFTKVGLTETETDRSKLESIMTNAVYEETLKRMRTIEDILNKHGKSAITSAWNSTTTTTMANIYNEIRNFLIAFDGDHDVADDQKDEDSGRAKYISKIADLKA